MKSMTRITVILLLIMAIFFLGCSKIFRNRSTKVDEKYYCENEYDCVSGQYCEVTEAEGCVGAKWWQENVGNRFDCEPDPGLCRCINNICISTDFNQNITT